MHPPDARHDGPSDLVLSLHCFGYGAARRMGTGALTEDRSSDPFLSLFRDEAPLRNAEEWLLQADYAATKSPHQKDAQRRRDEVKSMLLEILPEVEDIAFVADSGENPRRPKPAVRIKTPYGWISLRDLSLGYKTLIAWTVDLASRLYETYYRSENPLAEAAVVLVDEIDLHLHPAWQRKILSYLSERFPNTQFIVTAHSPLVVQAAADANIVVLRREGDHVLIDNDTENVRGWRVDQLLTSDLFGLPSARSAALDEAIERRKQLLAKARLTAKDRRELSALEEQIGDLPTGVTPADIRAMDIIRRAAAKLAAGATR